MINYLLFGSLANTNSEGGLGSPEPEILIADTRNSYSIPSTTSFTAYFFSVGKAISHTSQWISKPVFNENITLYEEDRLCPGTAPLTEHRQKGWRLRFLLCLTKSLTSCITHYCTGITTVEDWFSTAHYLMLSFYAYFYRLPLKILTILLYIAYIKQRIT